MGGMQAKGFCDRESVLTASQCASYTGPRGRCQWEQTVASPFVRHTPSDQNTPTKSLKQSNCQEEISRRVGLRARAGHTEHRNELVFLALLYAVMAMPT